jgi:hypothetical protein
MHSTTEIDSLAAVARLVNEHPEACVRYGADPREQDGRGSLDSESGIELPGLSVNPLGAEVWWSRPLEDWIARQLCQYRHLADQSDDDRRAWVLTGRQVGRGPDCEPLLADVEVLAVIAPRALDEAEDRYVRHFEARRGPED